MAFFVGACIAAVIGFLVAQDANSRGMSGVGWGLGTFLLCIVFLPLYLLVRRPPLAAYQAPGGNLFPAPGAPVLCPTCGKYHEGYAAYCPHCGAAQFR